MPQPPPEPVHDAIFEQLKADVLEGLAEADAGLTIPADEVWRNVRTHQERMRRSMHTTRTEVRVTHRFSADPESVFDAWLDTKNARTWLFATESGEMVRAEIDARAGGSFVFVDRRAEEDVEHVGKYLEIDRPRRLVFTFAVPKYSAESTRVSIDIVQLNDGCELTLIHEGVYEDYKDRTESGWAGILQGLEKSLVLPDELSLP